MKQSIPKDHKFGGQLTLHDTSETQQEFPCYNCEVYLPWLDHSTVFILNLYFSYETVGELFSELCHQQQQRNLAVSWELMSPT